GVDRLVGTAGHLDEREALGAVRVAVDDDLGREDLAELAEEFQQVVLRHVVGQVADVELLGHGRPPREWASRRADTRARRGFTPKETGEATACRGPSYPREPCQVACDRAGPVPNLPPSPCPHYSR